MTVLIAIFMFNFAPPVPAPSEDAPVPASSESAPVSASSEGVGADGETFFSQAIITDTLIGLLLVFGGVFLGFMVRSWIRNKQSALEHGTAQLLEGSNKSIDLSQSLAIEADELIKRCQAVDERFLGKTLAIMIGDFQQADQIADRQKALVSAVDILEKLMQKLSPWYVRKEKFIAMFIRSQNIT